MKILVANLGSTSLKYRLYDFSGGQECLLTRGGVERVADHAQAIDSCLGGLRQGAWITNASDLAAVGFKTVMARGVNGCVRLDESVVRAMEECNPIAPAHNPPCIAGIRLFAKRLPGVPLVGLFETAFYQWAPEAAMRYAVPEAWRQAGVRRWGFHGASHKFIAERSAELLCREDVASRARQLYVDGGKSPVREPALRVASCHLGGSSSVTGIRSAGLTLDQAEQVLCKESGLKGLSGGYNDIRDIVARAPGGNAAAKLALDVFAQQTRHWIGSYFLQLNGLDALVFTAGIGENQPSVREAVCRDLDQLGLVLDPKLNAATKAREAVISAPESAVKIIVIPSHEELVVAREVRRFLQNNQQL
jgi:acetate kinase